MHTYWQETEKEIICGILKGLNETLNKMDIILKLLILIKN